MAKHSCSKRMSLLDRVTGFDETNLACAKIILADREKYERLNARGLIDWAELSIARIERSKDPAR